MLDTLLDTISILAWIIFAVYLVAYVGAALVRGNLKEIISQGLFLKFWLPFSVVVMLWAVSYALVFVEPQHVGVVISLFAPNGHRPRPLEAGLHWIIPLVEEVTIYPTYWHTYTMSHKAFEGEIRGNDSIIARTSDGQEVAIDGSAIFRIDSRRAIQIHLEWQGRYIDDFVRPILRGEVRTQVSQFTVNEVNSSKRLLLEQALETRLRQLFEDKGFLLDRYIVRNIGFSPEYGAAVEQKQVADQGILEKRNKAEQIRAMALGEADRTSRSRSDFSQSPGPSRCFTNHRSSTVHQPRPRHIPLRRTTGHQHASYDPPQ
jgi:regulator of protease activity HflC (stomatin/prohibitin superfamily)